MGWSYILCMLDNTFIGTLFAGAGVSILVFYLFYKRQKKLDGLMDSTLHIKRDIIKSSSNLIYLIETTLYYWNRRVNTVEEVQRGSNISIEELTEELDKELYNFGLLINEKIPLKVLDIKSLLLLLNNSEVNIKFSSLEASVYDFINPLISMAVDDDKQMVYKKFLKNSKELAEFDSVKIENIRSEVLKLGIFINKIDPYIN
ncbi:MAG: hypothetical protein ACI88L_000174 [Candidatus Paceibacteria bacterium]|jgi:hypothetical protein